MYIRLSTMLMGLFLVGCSTFPDKIKVADTSQLISYEEASSNAEQVKGKMLRWGGAIAKIENKADSTLLEMVYYPLTGYGRPVAGDESMGRFRIHVKGFMDPMVYQVGRLMTFTAVLDGVEQGFVGEHEYVFPTANVTSYYLWKNIPRVDIRRVHLWHQDYWFGHYPRPYNRRFFIRGVSHTSRQGIKSTRPSGATTYPKPVQTQRVEK